MKVDSRSFVVRAAEVVDVEAAAEADAEADVPLPALPAASAGGGPGGGQGGGPAGPATSPMPSPAASPLWVLRPWLANRFFSSAAWSAVRLPLLT